eukprot:SAG31_NODE_4433_length_3235_cov_1.532844_3_plen_69_part_00
MYSYKAHIRHSIVIYQNSTFAPVLGYSGFSDDLQAIVHVLKLCNYPAMSITVRSACYASVVECVVAYG